jgi:cell division protein DivIC
MNALKKEKVKQLQSDYQKYVEEREKLVLYRRRGLVRRLTAFGIIFSIVGYLMISTFFSQSEALQHKIVRKQQLENELKDLKKAQVRLEEEIIKLNDDEYIAKIARRDYFLSNENEIIFSVSEN